MKCPECSSELIIHRKTCCSACERHICPNCKWGTAYFCPSEKPNPSQVDDLICGRHCICGKRAVHKEPVCNRYCSRGTAAGGRIVCSAHSVRNKDSCVCCSAYDYFYPEYRSIYRTYGFVCSECGDGILGR